MDGPHRITITPTTGRVIVRAGDQVLVDTARALTLQEGALPAVQYLPREDADLALFERTDHASHCPFKGDASYFSIPSLGDLGTNVVWTYETPLDEVAEITGHLAFYADRVEIEHRAD